MTLPTDPANQNPLDPTAASPASPPVGGNPAATPSAPAASATPAADPTAPQLVKVKWGGREYSITQEAADIIKKQQDALAAAAPPRQPAPSPAPKADDIEDEWFVSPKAARERLAREIREEIKAEYQRDQAQQKFWGDFYKKNPDLSDDRFIVDAIMAQRASEWGDLPVTAASELLATAAREEVARILTRSAQGTNTKPVTEPASPRRPAAKPDASKTPELKSLGALLASRRAAHRRLTGSSKPN